MKKTWYVLLLLGILSSCQAQSGKNHSGAASSPISVLSASAYKTILEDKNIQLIDVRTPAEYAQGNIKGAVNIDVTADGFSQAVSKLDRSKPVAVYCRSGGRSQTATAILKDLGFKQIYDLKGGYMAWPK